MYYCQLTIYGRLKDHAEFNLNFSGTKAEVKKHSVQKLHDFMSHAEISLKDPVSMRVWKGQEIFGEYHTITQRWYH